MTAPGGTIDAPSGTIDGYAFEEEEARPVAVAGIFSVGAYLASHRRLRGMTLEDLEALTRIPRRSLARLESGAFDRHQDAFVRGFVRTVSVAIGLDPGDTLLRMLTGEAPCPPRRVRRIASAGLLAAGAALLLVIALGFVVTQLIPSEIPVDSADAPPAEPQLARRDFVRELADRVREAPPGTYARARALESPPAMYLAPAPVPAELDTLLFFHVPEPQSPAAVSAAGR